MFVRHKYKVKYIITISIPKITIKKNYFFSLQYIRMSGKNINFNDNEIQKSYFHKSKKIHNMEEFDTNKILVSKKESYGTKNLFKFFIGCNDNDVIRLLCLRLSQMTGYVKKFFDVATISFRVNNKQLLKKYNKLWEKVEKLMKIYFESKFVYDDKYKKKQK